MKKQLEKPIYKRGWFFILIAMIVIVAGSMASSAIKKSAEQKVEYAWPDNELAGMIPVPESKYGRIVMENDSLLQVDVYKLSKDQFEAYAGSCKDSGFTVDYTKTDESFLAENEDGYALVLIYDSEQKTMSISLSTPVEELELSDEDIPEDLPEEGEGEDTQKEPEEPDEAGEPENKESEYEEIEDAGGIRPELKEVLDSYEAFIDEYCEFMREYNESDDAAMIAKYSEMMNEYLEYVDKVDELGEEPMNDAEAEYYAEVTLRASQKLLEVSQLE